MLLSSWSDGMLRALRFVVAAAVAATVVAVGPSSDVRAAEAPPPAVIHSPVPAPGEVVASGRLEVGARVWSSRPIVDARIHLDGEPSEVEPVVASADDGASLSMRIDVPPGPRTLRLDVTDDAGATVSRTWSFAASPLGVERHAGADRLQTAVTISEATFPRGAAVPAAVLARADDFADALAGVPLAAAEGGPLLLSHRTSLPEVVAGELSRVLSPGGTVHLLGGTAALDERVAQAVRSLGFRTRRHAGSDRFGTAAAVAAALPPSSGAVLASGTSFPDALAASAPAARDGLPILLTARDALPDATRAVLADREIVTIAGGSAAVGDAVEQAVAGLVPAVRRVSGADRYATAVALAETFYDDPEAVSLASGLAFPDALAGTRHAVAADQPLLLTHPAALPRATADAIATLIPRRIDVYGGQSAVGSDVTAAARRVAMDGPARPRLLSAVPRAASTQSHLRTVELRFDRPVDAGRSTVHLEVGAREIPGSLRGAGDSLTFEVGEGQHIAAQDVSWPGRVVVEALPVDGGPGHEEVAFAYLEPDPEYATTGPVSLTLPSRGVDMIGFHQSGHPGAQAQSARQTATPKMTLPSRGRGTGLTTAADVVADPDMPVLAPVTGRVIRGGSYVLYCDHTDEYAVIAPDARPDWEVKILHVHGLQVGAGDRVVAGETVIAAGPRQLPFDSQVDDYSSTRWPHVHLEVVDPSIPPKPGGGC